MAGDLSSVLARGINLESRRRTRTLAEQAHAAFAGILAVWHHFAVLEELSCCSFTDHRDPDRYVSMRVTSRKLSLSLGEALRFRTTCLKRSACSRFETQDETYETL